MSFIFFPRPSLKIQFGGLKRVIPPGPDGYVSFSRACDIIIPLRGLKMMMMIITTRNNNRSSCSTQEHCTARHNNQMAAKGNGQASRKRERTFLESQMMFDGGSRRGQTDMREPCKQQEAQLGPIDSRLNSAGCF